MTDDRTEHNYIKSANVSIFILGTYSELILCIIKTTKQIIKMTLIWTGPSLRKHAYSILRILQPKEGKFSDKKIWYFFHISAQNIDCGYSLEPPRRGGCNEYPQSMFWSRNMNCGYSLEPPRRGGCNEYPQSIFWSRNMKNNVYPCKPQFYYVKVGFKGVKII